MKDIDFVALDYDGQDILEYPYSLEAYDYNKPCGGCRVRNKNDLKNICNLIKKLNGIIIFHLILLQKKNIIRNYLKLNKKYMNIFFQ